MDQFEDQFDEPPPRTVGSICGLQHVLDRVERRLHVSEFGFAPRDRALECGHGKPPTDGRASLVHIQPDPAGRGVVEVVG